MPPFFDVFQLQTAVTARALPTLEHLAANPNQLDRSLDNRFERDDPPPYESSSESEEEAALHHPVLARSAKAFFEEFKDILAKPLNDYETLDVVQTIDWVGVYNPGRRYDTEAKEELDRLSTFWRSSFWEGGSANAHVHELLKGPRGCQRRKVIARRNVRKRWQRLGIWNLEWGIPGRINRQPNDNFRDWKWKWQPSTAPPRSDPRHPGNRTVHLRRNLAYGEHAPPPPRSHLGDDSSASEAESSFIISRPWFIFAVESFEFDARLGRIPVEQRACLNNEQDTLVTTWWKERGDWEPGWKWRHESPSPEPEDLTPLNTDDMDFTPSEVDALEAIPFSSPPRPEPPLQARVPGNIFGTEWLAGWEPAEAPRHSIFGTAHRPEDHLVQELEEQPLSPPPRQQPQPAEVPAAPSPPPQPAPPSPPPLRRSARIAARKANAPPPAPPATARAKRTRMSRGPPAGPSSPRGTAPSAADAPQERRRSRRLRDGGTSKSVAPTSKKARRASGRIAVAVAAAS